MSSLPSLKQWGHTSGVSPDSCRHWGLVLTARASPVLVPVGLLTLTPSVLAQLYLPVNEIEIH